MTVIRLIWFGDTVSVEMVMARRGFRSLCLFVMLGLLGLGTTGCAQLLPLVDRLRSMHLSPKASSVPHLYTGSSSKENGQNVSSCIDNARSILSGNGYIDEVSEETSDDGTTAWIWGSRRQMGITAEFQCASNGVTVLAMSGLDNDKLYSEYDRIHDLNW